MDATGIRCAALALPPPFFDENLWMASCRPRNSTMTFSKHTLLFQPDCRRFCLDGAKCKQKHDPSLNYVHASSSVVRAAAEKDAEEHATFVVNASKLSVRIPYVRQCWSVSSADTFAATSLPDTFYQRTVVVWVHGFRQTFLRTVEVSRHLQQRTQEAVETLGCEAPLVLPFLWPAYTHEISYANARRNACCTGSRLTDLLMILYLRQCRVIILGHSLGCRLALQALHSNTVENRVSLCSHLILVSAAVQCDALSPDGRYPRNEVAADHIAVVSSKQDEILRKYFSVGESTAAALFLKAAGGASSRYPEALGYVGPSDSTQSGVHSVHAPISHSEHSALASPELGMCIRKALSSSSFDSDLAAELDYVVV